MKWSAYFYSYCSLVVFMAACSYSSSDTHVPLYTPHILDSTEWIGATAPW